MKPSNHFHRIFEYIYFCSPNTERIFVYAFLQNTPALLWLAFVESHGIVYSHIYMYSKSCLLVSFFFLLSNSNHIAILVRQLSSIVLMLYHLQRYEYDVMNHLSFDCWREMVCLFVCLCKTFLIYLHFDTLVDTYIFYWICGYVSRTTYIVKCVMCRGHLCLVS